MPSTLSRWGTNRSVLVLILMASYSIQSLLITASKRRGGFEYDVAVTVFYAEFFKFLFAISMLGKEGIRGLNFWSSFPYLIPSVLYLVQNQLIFAALSVLSPPEYQLLNNGKLFTTTIVYRVVMKRTLRVVQWLALALLGTGMVLSTQPAASDGASAAARGASEQLWKGCGIMVLVSWCSAIAGVSNEKLIKGSASVVQANVWLYGYGCLACLLQLCFSSSGLESLVHRRGFTPLTWLVVVCNAVLGQSIAYIMRYADSIVKIYAVCMAMIFTTLASVFFFGYELHLHVVGGYVACVISLCLYYCPAELLMATDSEVLASYCSRRTDGSVLKGAEADVAATNSPKSFKAM